jgi:thioredoxin 1
MDTNNANNAHNSQSKAQAPIATGANGKINVVTDKDFIAEVLEAGTPVLVDFWAPWCGPCKYMGPVFAQLAPEYEGKVKFAKLDVDDNPNVAGALNIQSIPTFMLIRGRTVYAEQAGALQPHHLRSWIDAALAHMESGQAKKANGAD